jgi:hypothetical protein
MRNPGRITEAVGLRYTSPKRERGISEWGPYPPTVGAKQSFADVRAQTEFGPEGERFTLSPVTGR